MTDQISFMSTRGNCYTAAECERIVIQRIARKWRGCLVDGWQSVIRAKFADRRWLQLNNNCIPGALVRDLEMDAVTYGR